MSTDIFNSVQQSKIGGNTFDLTHSINLSTKIGKLTPCCVMEVLPGDSFDIQGNALVRLAPTVAPVMHRMDVFTHYFFVPNRILWDGWDDFITGGEDGNDNTVHPFIKLNSTTHCNVSELPDYMGIPTNDPTEIGPGKNFNVNPMPFAAYQKIYHDYYRDENLIPKYDIQLTDGSNNVQIPMLLDFKTRAWQKDYFTSALPWTQRGPEALLPLNGTAALELIDPTNVQQFLRTNGPGNPPAFNTGADPITWDFPNSQISQQSFPGSTNYVSVEDSHQVDLTTATSTSIIELRRAFALQEWLEKNATGGSRYIESMAVHFGVQSSDKRLQRPEYIGGFSSPIKMSEVLQTSETTATTPQGNMAGHGISAGGSKTYSYKSEEHGYIIGIMSVLPKATYQTGLERHWLRTEAFDYPFPSFAHIGEQPIENIELYIDGSPIDQETFGYTPRYAEMKFMNNRVAGNMRTNLDIWHMSRKFSATQLLNQDFIECNHEEVNRIFAVIDPTVDHLWCQVLNNVKAYRKLPVFGTPKIT